MAQAMHRTLFAYRANLITDEGIIVDDLAQPTGDSAQQKFFRITDNIPEETWYWLALASIGVSAGLKLADKNSWSLFVGQWPPTFILFGLYHRLIRPSEKAHRQKF